MTKRRKPYEAHELLYQRMRTKGIRSWEQYNAGNQHRQGLDVFMEQLLKVILMHPWAPNPKQSKALELGCGTGPISRRLAKRGFDCLGIDISKTAIRMAREQSKGLNVRFKQTDACNPDLKSNQYSLIVDGHCLHCITQPEDRKSFLTNAYRLLKPDGVFVISTMCGPVDRKAFHELFGVQRLMDSKVYVPWDRAKDYAHSRTIRGKLHIPTRYIGHWKDILADIKAAGFHPQFIQLHHPCEGEPVSTLKTAVRILK
ncbi:MAG: class I SAM-dependent methyltransferase [Phycisphaerae bacterium]|nr:class I SAM-dependent methyltransferase [Phycisphaerae bacterium]